LIFFFSEAALTSHRPAVTAYVQEAEHKGEKRGRFIVPVQNERPSKSLLSQEFLLFPLL